MELTDPIKMRIRAIVFETLCDMATGNQKPHWNGNVETRHQLVTAIGTVLVREGFLTREKERYLHTDQYTSDVEIVADEILFELLHKNVIKYRYNSNDPVKHFSFVLTEHGRKVLQAEPEPTVYDATGFMARFDETCVSPPGHVRGFLAAAVKCFNEHSDPALSAVYLGTASEILIDSLMQAVWDNMEEGEKKKTFRKSMNNRSIESRFLDLMKPLKKMVEDKVFPSTSNHKNTISLINTGFDLIRCTRNEAGHPVMPHALNPSDMYFHLHSFPVYAARVCELIVAVESIGQLQTIK